MKAKGMKKGGKMKSKGYAKGGKLTKGLKNVAKKAGSKKQAPQKMKKGGKMMAKGMRKGGKMMSKGGAMGGKKRMNGKKNMGLYGRKQFYIKVLWRTYIQISPTLSVG